MSKKMTIMTDATAPPLNEQLADQGISLSKPQTDFFQGLLDSVTRLAVPNILTESESARARRRIIDRISLAVTCG